MYCRRDAPINKLSQGDIFEEIETSYDVKIIAPENKDRQYIDITYTHAIILTQDCDLEQDFKNRNSPNKDHDKFIPCILLAPAYHAEKLREGKHLEKVGLTMQRINGDRWKPLVKNQALRYHYLPKNLDLNIPELVIDFKHYFTMSRNLFCGTIMKNNYVASLGPLYREHLSDRFTHYLSRIGLPDPEPTAPAPQQV